MSVRAGRLQYRVTIQQYSLGSPQQTGSGEPDGSWTTFATVYSSVEPLSGREFLTAQQISSETMVRMRMRYLAGVTTAMRVLFESKVYNIKAIIDFEMRHKEMTLMCSEGLNNG